MPLADPFVDALDLSTPDRAWAESILTELEPGWGHRAALADVTRATLARRFPDALAAWDAYAARMPRYAPFSMRPAREIFLLCCRAASLAEPARTLDAAYYQFTLDSFDAIVESPILRPLFVACDGDPGRFFEATASSNRLVDNFGERRLERIAQRHYVFVLDGWPPGYARAIIVPYLEGVLQVFGREGRVEFEHERDSGRVVIDVDWR